MSAFESVAEFDDVMEALLVGLASYGELERLRDAHLGASMSKTDVLHDLRPIMPVASPDTAGQLGRALLSVWYRRPEAIQSGEGGAG